MFIRSEKLTGNDSSLPKFKNALELEVEARRFRYITYVKGRKLRKAFTSTNSFHISAQLNRAFSIIFLRHSFTDFKSRS